MFKLRSASRLSNSGPNRRAWQSNWRSNVGYGPYRYESPGFDTALLKTIGWDQQDLVDKPDRPPEAGGGTPWRSATGSIPCANAGDRGM